MKTSTSRFWMGYSRTIISPGIHGRRVCPNTSQWKSLRRNVMSWALSGIVLQEDHTLWHFSRTFLFNCLLKAQKSVEVSILCCCDTVWGVFLQHYSLIVAKGREVQSFSLGIHWMIVTFHYSLLWCSSSLLWNDGSISHLQWLFDRVGSPFWHVSGWTSGNIWILTYTIFSLHVSYYH